MLAGTAIHPGPGVDHVRGARGETTELERSTSFDATPTDIRPGPMSVDGPGRTADRAATVPAIDGEAMTGRMRTATVMRSTARALLDTAAVLHRCARLSAVAQTRDRLDRLGGEASARADAIGLRADRLAKPSPS
jgi:hypothetical protein